VPRTAEQRKQSEIPQEPLPSQIRGAVVESVPDTSEDSLVCSEAAITPSPSPVHAAPQVESATPPEPELEPDIDHDSL